MRSVVKDIEPRDLVDAMPQRKWHQLKMQLLSSPADSIRSKYSAVLQR